MSSTIPAGTTPQAGARAGGSVRRAPMRPSQPEAVASDASRRGAAPRTGRGRGSARERAGGRRGEAPSLRKCRSAARAWRGLRASSSVTSDTSSAAAPSPSPSPCAGMAVMVPARQRSSSHTHTL
eukprot:scaffold165_cov265-Prasinococcus_capsulatus_cf.AAC.4